MKITIAIILIALFILSGCDSFSSNQQGGTTSQARIGTQGIALSFLQNQPPSKVIVQESTEANANIISVGLDIRNMGAETVQNGVLVYSGFDPNLVSWGKISDPNGDITKITNLQGKTQYNTQGDRDLKDIKGQVNVKAINEKYTPVFQASLCYLYATHAQVPVCLMLDPYGNSPKACTPRDFSDSTGQGAPIAVIAVSQDSAPGNTIFKITVKNTGGGDVFNGAPDKCANSLTFKELDRVHVSKIKIGNADLSCKGLDSNGNLLLNGGQGILFCTLKAEKTSAYTTTLNIDMDYTYRTTTSTRVEITKIQ